MDISPVCLCICDVIVVIFCSGVATFCRNSASPVAAEEGLTGLLPSCTKDDIIKCYGDLKSFTQEEVSQPLLYHIHVVLG